MTVRGKFQLQYITENYWNKEQRTLKFSAVCNDGTPENERFHKYTPSGTLEMTVDNPTALSGFKLGAYYYLDFTPVE
jgi:hypothetical protein